MRVVSILIAFLCGINASLLELTTENFDEYVLNNGKSSFVKFYAPWCGHCKRLAPTWDELAEKLSETPDVQIAKLDCTAHQAICSRYGVSGYPTLKYFTEEKQGGESYAGGRGFDELKKFVDENLAPNRCDISSAEKIKETCTEKEIQYLEKMKAKTADEIGKEYERVKGMAGKSMSKDAREWFNKRKSILKQLA